MSALVFFAPLFASQRRRMLAALALSLVTLAAGIALLGISGWFLTAAAITTAGAAFNLFAPSAGVRGLSFVRILSRYGEKLSGHDATLRLLSKIRAWLFGKLFPILPLSRHLPGRADLVSRLTADVEALDTAFLVALGPITTAALTGLAMSLGLWVVLPAGALAYAGAFFVAAILVPVALVAISRREGARALEASGLLRRAVLDSLDGHQDLVVFGEVPRARMAAINAGEALARSRRRLGILAALATALVQIATGAAMVGVLLAGLPALAAGTIDGPLLAGFVLAVVASFEACAVLVRSSSRLAAAAAAAERLKGLATQPVSVVTPERPVSVPAGGTITFDKVRFGHDPDRPVFSDLSFAIASGACAAIVGPSGAGKSTIAQLLVRLADPQEGAVRLNGVDLRTISLAELRQRVVMMTQDAPVFLDSVRNNLLIGRPDASDEELWAVLRAVKLDGLFASRPGQLEGFVGEAGLTLSAGQARRLCLARTLLSPADVIVLDEPTSGLDPETEAQFLADLPYLAGGRTVIVITHASLPEAGFDTVLQLRAGMIEPLHAS